MKRLIVILANRRILNNILVNNILILLRLDDWFARYINTYNYRNETDPSKSLQEKAGYSERPEINELLHHIHSELRQLQDDYFPDGGRVLDIGCGPGLFLKDFDDRYQRVGIDITPGMIEIARSEVPQATFHVGNFITYPISGRFDMIFSVGTLMYISKGKMRKFAEKTAGLLKPGGILFISYPHALSTKDLFFPDISYIQYSPIFIEKLFSAEFSILHHARAVDKKEIGKYDHDPFVNLVNPAFKTYKNSSILILQRN